MKLHFWMGLGAAHEAIGSKGGKSSDWHQLISITVGLLLALLITAGLFFLLH